jgi:hypothetical protein
MTMAAVLSCRRPAGDPWIAGLAGERGTMELASTGRPGGPAPMTGPALPAGDSATTNARRTESDMGKRARKKKARKKGSANHGKRPNS